MGADLDMNGNDLLNVANLYINGTAYNVPNGALGYAEFAEITSPPTPSADKARLYAIDSGGTTKLQVKDPTGTALDLTHFTQSGTGATLRTQQAKLRETVDARDFGVVGNGSTDDTAAIIAAIASVATSGGIVEFPAGFNCPISSRIDITVANVTLRGRGSETFHDTGTIAPSVRFKWVGATDSLTPMVLFSSPFGLTNKVLSGGGIENIMLDCNRIKGMGLQILSRRFIVVKDIFVLDATNRAFWLTCGVTGTDYGEAADIQDGAFERLRWRMVDAAAVQSAHGMYLAGSSNANTSFNLFLNCVGQTYNGTGFLLENADNNVFQGCRNFSTVGAGIDFDLKGPTAGGLLGGQTNYFIGCSWGPTAGDFTLRGTDAGFTAGTTDNVLITEDIGNSSAEPVLGTGCSIIRSTRAAFLSIKGTTSSSRTLTDITGTANQALRVNSGGTAIAFGALDLTQAATATATFTTYSPSFTSASGTLGTQTLNRARYVQVGKIVTVLIDVSITSAGTTPGGAVRITLPVTATNVAYSGGLTGYELTSGNILAGYVDGTNSRANVTLTAGAFAGSNGNRLMMTLVYEAA